MKSTCCICNEIAYSPYGVVKHLDDGKSRVYEGHKSCLFLLETKLKQGVNLKHTEYERTKL